MKTTKTYKQEIIDSLNESTKDIVAQEKMKAAGYGTLGGVLIGSLLGGGASLLMGTKKKNRLRNALIGAGLGGLAGGLGLHYLQSNKLDNVGEHHINRILTVNPMIRDHIDQPVSDSNKLFNATIQNIKGPGKDAFNMLYNENYPFYKMASNPFDKKPLEIN